MRTLTVMFRGDEFHVTFDYFKARRGARDSLGGIPGAGPPLEPDEPESIEIETIEFNGLDVTDTFSDDEFDTISQLVLESMIEDAASDHYDYEKENDNDN